MVEVVPDRKIVLKWEAYEGPPPEGGGDIPAEAAAGYQTTVTMEFEPQGDDRTLVTIAEEGWRQDRARPAGQLRQLPGLGADAVRDEGLGRARHQSARGLLQIAGVRRA